MVQDGRRWQGGEGPPDTLIAPLLPDDILIYDMLPKQLRDALKDANSEYIAATFMEYLLRGVPAHQLLKVFYNQEEDYKVKYWQWMHSLVEGK